MVARDVVSGLSVQQSNKVDWIVQLSAKSLEEVEAERDSAVRRKLKALFNKTEADFPSLDDLRDYEEMVEDLIYNLVHSINVEETTAAIEKYKQENIRQIAINQMKINQKFEEEQTIIQQDEERTRALEREFMVCLEPLTFSFTILDRIIFL